MPRMTADNRRCTASTSVIGTPTDTHVGLMTRAVELGKAMGARVVAAASTEAKAAVARAHGADATVVYPAEVTDAKALAALFKDACGKRGADVIYDPVGGDTFDLSTKCIAFSGRIQACW